MPLAVQRWNQRPMIQESAFNPGSTYFVSPRRESPNIVAAKAWGLVWPNETTDRSTPPALPCFDTSKSWFDRGHLIALELGGSDSLCNLVPQTREQNQHGGWRRHEIALKKMAFERWNTDRRYFYFGIEAVYSTGDSSDLGAFEQTVPSAIRMSFFHFASNAKGYDPQKVQTMTPSNAWPMALALGWSPSRLETRNFHNRLTKADMTAVSKEVVASNREHAIRYCCGAALHDFTLETGEVAAEQALAIFADAVGGRMPVSEKKKIASWRQAYAEVATSPEIKEDFIPSVSVAKGKYIESMTKTGLRRTESIDLGAPEGNASNDLDKLQQAFRAVKEMQSGEQEGPRKRRRG